MLNPISNPQFISILFRVSENQQLSHSILLKNLTKRFYYENDQNNFSYNCLVIAVIKNDLHSGHLYSFPDWKTYS